MGSPTLSGKILRFGPFELDSQAQQLRRAGAVVRIQPQPFKVLSVLVWRAGQIVTREELRQELWGNETFVDFEQGLNYCIRQIRTVLGDEAQTPHYVETLPRRGYRFVAPVRALEEASLPASQGSAPKEKAGKKIQRRLWIAIAAVIVVVLGLVATYVAKLNASRRLTEKDTLVIAEFSNSTGDPVFDDTLKTALHVSLSQSPFLNLLPESKIRATLKLMARPADTSLTPAIAGEVCQRTGSKAYIAGAIAALGSEYVLGLKAVNCQNGDTLAQEQATAPAKEKILKALGESTSRLRSKLGESLATVHRFDVPLYEATTPSLEALQAYSLGEKIAREKGPSAGMSYLLHAVELDPNFAMGYDAIAANYYTLAETGRAREYFAKSFQNREHASEREKLEITANYYADVTGELDKAIQTYREWIESYPRDYPAYNDLAGMYCEQGKYEESEEPTRESLRLLPDGSVYANLANTLLAMQRFDEAQQTIAQAQAQKLDSYLLRDTLYALAFIREDSAGMAQQLQWFEGKPEENFAYSLSADTEAYGGHLAKARELTQRALDSAIQADSQENGAIWLENAALREAAFGNLERAKQTAMRGYKMVPGSEAVELEAALAFAMADDTRNAESLAADLNKRFPLETQTQQLWLPATRAQLALNRKDAPGAIRTLQSSVPPVEYGEINSVANLSCLYPTYIRGEAYLAEGQGVEAAAEFQKILDHSGIVWNCWTGTLAHLGVARANALQARTSHGADADSARVRALGAYKDFLALWRSGDSDMPILRQAKAEYAKLQ